MHFAARASRYKHHEVVYDAGHKVWKIGENRLALELRVEGTKYGGYGLDTYPDPATPNEANLLTALLSWRSGFQVWVSCVDSFSRPKNCGEIICTKRKITGSHYDFFTPPKKTDGDRVAGSEGPRLTLGGLKSTLASR